LTIDATGTASECRNRNDGQTVTLPLQDLHYLQEFAVNGLIYLIGLVVVIMAVLSFVGLH